MGKGADFDFGIYHADTEEGMFLSPTSLFARVLPIPFILLLESMLERCARKQGFRNSFNCLISFGAQAYEILPLFRVAVSVVLWPAFLRLPTCPKYPRTSLPSLISMLLYRI